MNKHILAGVATLALLPVAAAAEGAFDGTWKIDLSATKWTKKPDVYLLKDGTFECKTCTPPFTVKADGSDQPVTGHPRYDTIAIKVVDDHTVTETYKKDGKTVLTVTTKVAADGKTDSFEFNQTMNGKTVTGKGDETRVAAGPAGSHAISGSWQTSDVGSISDSAVTWTYKTTATGLQMSDPVGESYEAGFDGKDAPFAGNPNFTTVSLKKLSANTIVETDKRDGKPITVSKMTVSADGKTMTLVETNELRKTTDTFKATKQ